MTWRVTYEREDGGVLPCGARTCEVGRFKVARGDDVRVYQIQALNRSRVRQLDCRMGILSRKPTDADFSSPEARLWPGHWGAIESAFQQLHPGVEPLRVGRHPSIDENCWDGSVHVYDAGDHWHLITYGLSDVKGLTDGWPGFELTLRVDPPEVQPDVLGWPMRLLVSLADYVVSTGKLFGPGSRMESSTPLNGDEASTARSLIFVPDISFEGGIVVATGEVAILQVVPVTLAELQLSRETSVQQLDRDLSADNPLLIARLYR